MYASAPVRGDNEIKFGKEKVRKRKGLSRGGRQKVEGKRTGGLCLGAWVLMGGGLKEIVEGNRK